MTEETYRLVFKGEILKGHDPETVKKNVAKIFKKDVSGIKHLFTGKKTVLKKDVDYQTAKKFHEMFKSAGARLIVQKTDSEPQSPSPSVSDAAPKTKTKPPPLAPKLREKQRKAVEKQTAPKPLTVTTSVATGQKICKNCKTPNPKYKNECINCGSLFRPNIDKTVLLLLTIFTGGVGGHKFYVGNYKHGAVYLIFCWTLIPGIISLVEFVIYARKDSEELQELYGESITPNSPIVAIIASIVGIMFLTIIIIAAIAVPLYLKYQGKIACAQVEGQAMMAMREAKNHFATYKNIQGFNYNWKMNITGRVWMEPENVINVMARHKGDKCQKGTAYFLRSDSSSGKGKWEKY